MVRFGEFSWSWFEPREGEFQWAAYDRFVDLCQERELRLVLCTMTATLPPWLLKKHPDCRLILIRVQVETNEPAIFRPYAHSGVPA